MPRIETNTYYKFSELTEAQQKAYFEKFPEKFEPDDYWYECSVEDISEALESIGFNNVKVYCRGFWSQGDGAQFVGDYSYKKGALTQVKKDYPQWHELHTLCEALQKAQRQYFYNIVFNIKSDGHYSHEYCTSFNFEDKSRAYGWTNDNFNDDKFIEPCRDFMRHIYSSLEKEYDYLQSWIHVSENIDLFEYIEIEQKTLDKL